jgi:hypothetical protein
VGVGSGGGVGVGSGGGVGVGSGGGVGVGSGGGVGVGCCVSSGTRGIAATSGSMVCPRKSSSTSA